MVTNIQSIIPFLLPMSGSGMGPSLFLKKVAGRQGLSFLYLGLWCWDTHLLPAYGQDQHRDGRAKSTGGLGARTLVVLSTDKLFHFSPCSASPELPQSAAEKRKMRDGSGRAVCHLVSLTKMALNPKETHAHAPSHFLHVCLFFLLMKTTDKCPSRGREGNAGRGLRIPTLNTQVMTQEARDPGAGATS